ncbi:unnamed protein product [Bursaphelenchus xylophilus]|uniref:(pine wood nematode) hypothetical protein n=1 Tax=Bursaphelenchus xylophilus TaxID=6326 RepID=A0A1I7STJ8_BURXY|nr:unnamed protein product [Bursaphelenchus xylophilus]CAG9108320.1 unnamed protein product [Bursaphelenchus xylophilus]
MESFDFNSNGYKVKKVFKSKKERYDDPEQQAEALYAKENGLPAPVKKHNSAEEAKAAAINSRNRSKSTSDLKPSAAKPKTSNVKADRKARSRGVSGCYSKKDGNRFEYGLDDYVNQKEDVIDESDVEDGGDLSEDYIDYVYSFDVEKVHGALKEYFNNGSVECALADLTVLLFDRESKSRMAKEVMRCSLDYDQGRVVQGYKLLCALLDEGHLSDRNVLSAIEDLLLELEEIIHDMPKARGFLGTLIAKLISDGVIGRIAFDDITSKLNHSRQAMSCALEVYMYLNNKALLKGKFEDCGAYAPLEVLRDQMEKILREFLLSGDADEVSERLKELHALHFHHELVYLVGFYALDRMRDTTMEKLAGLLKHLLNTGYLLESCIEPGFLRLFKELPDLVIDIPAAYSLCDVWVKKCKKSGLISDGLTEKLPKNSTRRNRTLSEGADGKFQYIDAAGEAMLVA